MKERITKKGTCLISAHTKRLNSHSPEIASKMRRLSTVLMERNKKLYESLATK